MWQRNGSSFSGFHIYTTTLTCTHTSTEHTQTKMYHVFIVIEKSSIFSSLDNSMWHWKQGKLEPEVTSLWYFQPSIHVAWRLVYPWAQDPWFRTINLPTPQKNLSVKWSFSNTNLLLTNCGRVILPGAMIHTDHQFPQLGCAWLPLNVFFLVGGMRG